MSAEGFPKVFAGLLWRKLKIKFLLAFMKSLTSTTVLMKILPITLFSKLVPAFR
jgi:hypothetical protein